MPKPRGSTGRTRRAWAPGRKRRRRRCAIHRCIRRRGRIHFRLLARCWRCSLRRPRCSRCWHVRSVDRFAHHSARKSSRLRFSPREGEWGVHARNQTRNRLIVAEIVIRHGFTAWSGRGASFGDARREPSRVESCRVPGEAWVPGKFARWRNYARHLPGHDNDVALGICDFSSSWTAPACIVIAVARCIPVHKQSGLIVCRIEVSFEVFEL